MCASVARDIGAAWVLIEPCGIEIAILAGAISISSRVLIEPCGIEIIIMQNIIEQLETEF